MAHQWLYRSQLARRGTSPQILARRQTMMRRIFPMILSTSMCGLRKVYRILEDDCISSPRCAPRNGHIT
jgi:hypothetical protein